jgi:hypothetical protein
VCGLAYFLVERGLVLVDEEFLLLVFNQEQVHVHLHLGVFFDKGL